MEYYSAIKEWTTDTSNIKNMLSQKSQTQKNTTEQFHLYEVEEQVKLIWGNGNQDMIV